MHIKILIYFSNVNGNTRSLRFFSSLEKVHSSPFDILFDYFYRTYIDIFLFFPFGKDNRRGRCESRCVNLHHCLVQDSVAPQTRVLYTSGHCVRKDFPGESVEQGLSERIKFSIVSCPLFFSQIELPENLPCRLSFSTHSPSRPSPPAGFAERVARLILCWVPNTGRCLRKKAEGWR